MPPGLEPIDDAPPSFSTPRPAAPAEPEPLPYDEPAEPLPYDDAEAADSAPRALLPEDWEAALAAVRAQAPIQAGMIGQTLFVEDDGGLLTIAIHPEDTDSRDALLGGDVAHMVCEAAAAICGRAVSLRIVTDPSVPAPAEEEPLPPPPALTPPAPKPKAPEPEKKEDPAAATPTLKPTEDEFYKDPLIELALKEFHAKIIK